MGVPRSKSHSLNPSIPIGVQVQEVLLTHTGMTKREARERSEELLVEMGLPDASHVLTQITPSN